MTRVGWLTEPGLALNAIIVMHVWKNLGFFVVVFLVGLKDISSDYRDASLVDGANSWQRIWRIELPIMKPIILFGSVMASIWALSAFTEVYIMTQGTDVSTGVEISVLVYKIYTEGFRYFRMGYSAAICLILFVISMLLVGVQFFLFREK
jgi:multiple sugar transport system permease protein